MNKHAKKMRVPKLRFPEFRDTGEWISTTLGDLVDIQSGISPYRYDLFDKGNYAFLKVEDLNNCEKYQTKSREYSNETERLVPKNSVIFPKRGAAIQLNKVRINTNEVLMDTNLMAIIPNNKINFEFLYYKIYSVGLFKIADTSTIPQINNKHIIPYNVIIPTKTEQQKIANCLSSLDDLITAQTEKVEALKDHKKGLMQQLFPEEGKTLPKLRFPEFQDKGEWEEQEVGDIFKITRGYVLAMNLVSSNPTEKAPYPVYSSQTKNNGLSGYYTDYLYENAITWTTDGANAGDVNYRQGKFYCTNVCGVLINTDGYANVCVAALINTVSKNHVSYVGNPKLMNNVMSKIVVPLPSIQEQRKIADCLSSIDDLITAQTEKIEALKNHKKGLMQQLFPDVG